MLDEPQGVMSQPHQIAEKQNIIQEANIEIRLTGNGVNPQSMKAREVAELIKSLEDTLFYIVSAENKDIDREEIYISLTEVKNESAGFGFSPNLKAIMVAGFLVMANAISSDNYAGLPIKSIKGIKEILKISRKKNCNTEFKLNSEVRAVLHPNSSVEIPSSAYISGYTTIYPYIKKIGGTRPSIAMRINANDPFIYVQTSEEQAKKLGERLYSVVGLTGFAKWARDTKELVDFKIDKILDYQDSTSEVFEILRQELGSYWDAIEDIDEYLIEEEND